MAFLKVVFDKFVNIISDWSAWQIALLAAVVPIIITILQLIAIDSKSTFSKANKKLKKFLKKNCYVSSINLFLFNKKVCNAFPFRFRKVLKSLEGKDISMQEICTIFENYRVKSPKNIIWIAGIVHLIVVAVVMAMSGYYLSHISFVSLGLAVAWGLLYTGINFISAVYRNRESRNKSKFLFALKHSVQEIVKFGFNNTSDIEIVQKNHSEDSVYELARGVEEFISQKPNKSLAKIVYKSLYSANYTTAMSKESISYLKEIMQKLKEYSLS